jgi:hypothetical protein
MFLYQVIYMYVHIYIMGFKQEYLNWYMSCGKEFHLDILVCSNYPHYVSYCVSLHQKINYVLGLLRK